MILLFRSFPLLKLDSILEILHDIKGVPPSRTANAKKYRNYSGSLWTLQFFFFSGKNLHKIAAHFVSQLSHPNRHSGYHFKNLAAHLTFLLSKYFLNSSIPNRKNAKGTESNTYLRSSGEVLKIRLANGLHMIRARIRSSIAIPNRIARLLNKPIVKTDWNRVLEAKTLAIWQMITAEKKAVIACV